MKADLKTLKMEVYGEDYEDSNPDEPGSPEPQSPGLSPSGLSKGRTFRAPKEDDIKEIFTKLFSESIQGEEFKDLIINIAQGQMEQIKLDFKATTPAPEALLKGSQSVDSIEPPNIIQSTTPIKNEDMEGIEQKIKAMESSLVHCERQDIEFEKKMQKLENQIKGLQQKARERPTPILTGSVDKSEQPESNEVTNDEPVQQNSAALMELIDDAKDEFQQSINNLTEKFEKELASTKEKMAAQLKALGDISIQEKEETEQQFDRLKKQIATKLDSVFFDDELDELK